MKIKFFKLNTNKKFNYTPRHYKENNSVEAISFSSQIKNERKNSNYGANSQWNEARNLSRNRDNAQINKTLVVIFLILCFLTLWFFDFDISFFWKK